MPLPIAFTFADVSRKELKYSGSVTSPSQTIRKACLTSLNSYLLDLSELKALRQKDMTKEELVKMVKETMTKEELLSLLLGK